jgi:hypothetical protein
MKVPSCKVLSVHDSLIVPVSASWLERHDGKQSVRRPAGAILVRFLATSELPAVSRGMNGVIAQIRAR